jgi:S-formylglutathione hydrolase FrmB
MRKLSPTKLTTIAILETFTDQKQKKLSADHWTAYSPLYLLDSVDKEKLKSVRYYIDCGDEDFLYKGNSVLHVKIREIGIPHEFRVRNGGHEWSYWRTGLYDGLKFI